MAGWTVAGYDGDSSRVAYGIHCSFSMKLVLGVFSYI